MLIDRFHKLNYVNRILSNYHGQDSKIEFKEPRLKFVSASIPFFHQNLFYKNHIIHETINPFR